MPIMFHVLDLIRVYAYVAYNALVEEDERLEQNMFIMGIVETLQNRAEYFHYHAKTRTIDEVLGNDENLPPSKVRKRLSRKKPHYFPSS